MPGSAWGFTEPRRVKCGLVRRLAAAHLAETDTAMKRLLFCAALLGGALCVFGDAAGERVLTLEEFRDKMKGGWVGQMVGVSWGKTTEFKFNDWIIPTNKVPVWKSRMVLDGGYLNDDLYVDMCFLKTLEDHGPDVSIRQAGIDFANTEFTLWCANLEGRTNLRRGVAPPDCSHPRYSNCPNDIDYQIEADFSGIISPGCPQEVIRFGNIFGRLMNYGDGVWAGQFVGALYAEAYFTKDVDKLLDAGLAAIPAESDYAKMVRNVRAWHGKFPNDWMKCWWNIRENYQKKRNPSMKHSNGDIDVRLNGAAIVLGLLYGKGDVEKSMELSMRCGWDSDCNPSSVGGILMTAHGFKAQPAKYTEKLDYKRKFKYTAYDLPSLFAASERMARAVVLRSGGRIEKDEKGAERFVVPRKKPVPDAFVPSWNAPMPKGERFTAEEMKAQRFASALPDPERLIGTNATDRVQKALDAMYPGWKTTENKDDPECGFVKHAVMTDVRSSSTNWGGRGAVIGLVRTLPPSAETPVVLSRKLKVPTGNPRLIFDVSNLSGGDFDLIVRVNGVNVMKTLVETMGHDWTGHMRAFEFSLEPWEGRDATVEIVQQPNGGKKEAAFWRGLRITANSGDVD